LDFGCTSRLAIQSPRLADDGVNSVVTPKTGNPGHEQPAEIAESAPTAGLMHTS
jgi:hypothetical protein